MKDIIKFMLIGIAIYCPMMLLFIKLEKKAMRKLLLIFLMIPLVASAQPRGGNHSGVPSGVPVGNGVQSVTEEDGSPQVFPWQVKFNNGTITDNGDGTATHDVEPFTDGLYIRRDGGNSPTADIDWGGYNLTNATEIEASDAYETGSTVYTRDGRKVTAIQRVGGRNETISWSDNRISSFTDGTYTWTRNYNSNNNFIGTTVTP